MTTDRCQCEKLEQQQQQHDGITFGLVSERSLI